MPYLPTAQSFLQQSTLLISARPTTTRITTKYTLLKPSKRRIKTETVPDPAPVSSAAHPPTNKEPTTSQQQQPPKATLTLKTYDPVSGVCLKYQTDKAAEVGRLVASLGSCGRIMAALPAKEDGAEEGDGAAAVKIEQGARNGVKEREGKIASGPGRAGERDGGGGGGKKKKKGKR